jgi:hypothetical protein
MVKPGADTWRMWLGLGLGCLCGLNAVLAFSIGRNVNADISGSLRPDSSGRPDPIFALV